MQTWRQPIKLFFIEGEFKSIEKVSISLKKYEKTAFNECKERLKKVVKTYKNLRLNSISFNSMGDYPLIIFEFYYEATRTICGVEY